MCGVYVSKCVECVRAGVNVGVREGVCVGVYVRVCRWVCLGVGAGAGAGVGAGVCIVVGVGVRVGVCVGLRRCVSLCLRVGVCVLEALGLGNLLLRRPPGYCLRIRFRILSHVTGRTTRVRFVLVRSGSSVPWLNPAALRLCWAGAHLLRALVGGGFPAFHALFAAWAKIFSKQGPIILVRPRGSSSFSATHAPSSPRSTRPRVAEKEELPLGRTRMIGPCFENIFAHAAKRA
jgi:hypothetical protein